MLVKLFLPKGAQLLICGDLHGQYYNFLSIFDKYGQPSHINNYLFNGDFIDRGDNSFLTIVTLLTYVVLYPGVFFLCRGNHEFRMLNSNFGFKTEIIQIYGKKEGEKIYELLNSVFDYMSISYVVQNLYFVTLLTPDIFSYFFFLFR